MDRVDVGGIQIAYARVGLGSPLVMLHGAPPTAALGSGCFPTSHRDHAVVAWDARASGSRQTLTTWRAAQFADALAAFIAALGLERPHLVGHSSGRGRSFAVRAPPRGAPASLVLIGGYAGWAGSLPTEEVARRLEMFLGMAEMGDAFDPKSYPGLFTDLIPADRDARIGRDDA